MKDFWQWFLRGGAAGAGASIVAALAIYGYFLWHSPAAVETQSVQHGTPVPLTDLPDDLVPAQREWCASASSSSMDARTAAITKAACSP